MDHGPVSIGLFAQLCDLTFEFLSGLRLRHIAAKLKKPLLLEGPAGSGKIQLAISVAAAAGTLNTGLTQDEIDAVAADGPVQGLAPDYIVACSADELVRGGTLTDETLSNLLNHYGHNRTRKLILAIGHFALLAMFLNGCRVPLETSDKVGSSTSPPG